MRVEQLRMLLAALTAMILMIPLMSVLPLPPPPWLLMLLPVVVFGALVAQALFHAHDVPHIAQAEEKEFESIL